MMSYPDFDIIRWLIGALIILAILSGIAGVMLGLMEVAYNKYNSTKLVKENNYKHVKQINRKIEEYLERKKINSAEYTDILLEGKIQALAFYKQWIEEGLKKE